MLWFKASTFWLSVDGFGDDQQGSGFSLQSLRRLKPTYRAVGRVSPSILFSLIGGRIAPL